MQRHSGLEMFKRYSTFNPFRPRQFYTLGILTNNFV